MNARLSLRGWRLAGFLAGLLAFALLLLCDSPLQHYGEWGSRPARAAAAAALANRAARTAVISGSPSVAPSARAATLPSSTRRTMLVTAPFRRIFNRGAL